MMTELQSVTPKLTQRAKEATIKKGLSLPRLGTGDIGIQVNSLIKRAYLIISLMDIVTCQAYPVIIL